MKDKVAFTLTAAAVHRVKLLMSLHNNKRSTASPENGAASGGDAEAIGIRIGVKRRGCSGYSYTVNYAFDKDPNIKPGDTHVQQDGVNIYVDGNALFYVIGTVMNFTSTNVEEKFTFQNPNKTHSCGCDESFMVEGAR